MARNWQPLRDVCNGVAGLAANWVGWRGIQCLVRQPASHQMGSPRSDVPHLKEQVRHQFVLHVQAELPNQRWTEIRRNCIHRNRSQWGIGRKDRVRFGCWKGLPKWSLKGGVGIGGSSAKVPRRERGTAHAAEKRLATRP